jgi:hypothetical protein
VFHFSSNWSQQRIVFVLVHFCVTIILSRERIILNKMNFIYHFISLMCLQKVYSAIFEELHVSAPTMLYAFTL